MKYREKEKREEISWDSKIATQLHPIWPNGWKRERCGFLSCRRHSLVSQEAVPWQGRSPAHSCLHLEDHVQKTQGSPGFCCVQAVPAQQPLFPSHPYSNTQWELFGFWFSHFANSVTICQVLSMIFAWWKCWPYCESILTAPHSEVVRQWDKFTTQADKAASIMCGTTKKRRINEHQWKYLHDEWLQAQQWASAADWSDEGVGDSQVSLEGSCLVWLSWRCVQKNKEGFKAILWKVCSDREAVGKHVCFFEMVTFQSF